MQAIENILTFRKGFRDIRYKDMFFEKNGFIYRPVKDWVCDMGFVSGLSSYLVELEKSLPLLRESILDESLPLYVYNMPGLFAGGRVTDASILGMFKYSEALSELLEVAQHDLNYEMRAVSVESIGDIEKKSWNLALPLCDILLEDKNFFVKKCTSKALGRIGNPTAKNSLRDIFDEARLIIRSYEVLGYPFTFESNDPYERREVDSTCMLLENSIVSLFRLDKKLGREMLSIGLNDLSGTVNHWSKRAIMWCNYHEQKEKSPLIS